MVQVMGVITLLFGAVAGISGCIALFTDTFCAIAVVKPPKVTSKFKGIAAGSAMVALMWFLVTSVIAMMTV